MGLEENIFPHSRSMEDPDQMEEERRLMYVGVTRAKDRLYLVRAFRRMLYGRSEINDPSRFLRDVAAAQGSSLGMSPVRAVSSPFGWLGLRPRDRRRAGDEDSWGGASRRSRPDAQRPRTAAGPRRRGRGAGMHPQPPQTPRPAERPGPPPSSNPATAPTTACSGRGS